MLSKFMSCVLSRSVMSDSFVTLWTVAHQAPLSMEFPRQEYCSGLSFPSPGDIPHPGVKHESPVSPALQLDSLPSEPSEKVVFFVFCFLWVIKDFKVTYIKFNFPKVTHQINYRTEIQNHVFLTPRLYYLQFVML